MLRTCIICIIILSALAAKAQSPYYAGGRAAALANTNILLVDAWAVHNAPAASAWLQSPVAGVWVERKFNLKELTNGAVTAALPLGKGKAGTLGFGAYFFGATPYFQQQKLHISYALKIAPNISAGIGIHGLRTQIREPYGTRVNPIGNLNFLYKINTKTWAAAQVWNVAPTLLSTYQDERLPRIFMFGLRHSLSNQVLLLAEAEHQSGQKTGFKFGVEYKPVKNIQLQAGLNTYPLSYSAGAGFYYKKVNIHFGFNFHPVLATTSNVTLNYGALPADVQ